MKKFFIYILSVFIGVLFIDIINRIVCSNMYDRIPMNSELAREYNYITNKKTADILILGASRGIYSYNVGMIFDSLHLHCASVSNEGMSVFHQYLNLIRANKNGKIKYVILDLSPAQLSTDWIRNMTSVLYPFYWKDENVREIVKEALGSYSDIILSSSFVQYNSTIIDYIYKGYCKTAMDKDGYIPIDYTGKEFNYEEKDKNAKTEIDTLGIKYLDKIVALCKKENIRLVICDSPRLNKIEWWDDFLAEYSCRHHLPFWNYANYEPVVKDKKMFVDHLHINCKGADLFTEEIIKNIKILSCSGR